MDRSNKQAVILSITVASVLAISFAAAGYASSSIDFQDVLDIEYLEPCVGETCVASEEDYENLTTFELFAIYPELHDELEEEGEGTNISSDEEIDNEGEGGANETSSTPVMPSAPLANNNTTSSNQTRSTNSTGNFTG